MAKIFRLLWPLSCLRHGPLIKLSITTRVELVKKSVPVIRRTGVLKYLTLIFGHWKEKKSLKTLQLSKIGKSKVQMRLLLFWNAGVKRKPKAKPHDTHSWEKNIHSHAFKKSHQTKLILVYCVTF